MSFVDVNRIIEERINITDVVRRYVKLQQSGRRQTGLCPFHKEKTPSFSVNEERQFYHCFGCGAHGNALTFLMTLEHLSFREAVRKLGADFGVPELLREEAGPEEQRNEDERRLILAANRLAAVFFHRKLSEEPRALEYLAGRGIPADTIKRFGLGWVGPGDELVSFLRQNGVDSRTMERAGLARIDAAGRIRSFFYERIMIPVINQRRQVIGFGGRLLGAGEPKYLNTAETPVFSKRASLFGINLVRDGLRDHRYLILTEGYFDVVALHQNGFTTAVAALGTAITEEHLKLLERFGVPVVMLLDGDAAGRAAMRRTLELTIPEKMDLRAAFIESADGKEDPDSLVRRPGGRERMAGIISSALDIVQHYVEELAARSLELTSVPEKMAVLDELATILLRFPAHKRVGYLDHLASLHRRVRTMDAATATKLRKDVEARLRDRLRRGRTEAASPRVAEPIAASPEALCREILLLAAVHHPLIPALDDPEGAAAIDPHDRNGVRRALLAAYDADAGDATYRQLVAAIDAEGRFSEACRRKESDEAAFRFRQLLNKLRIADIDRTVKDLSAENAPGAIAEIQRLMQRKKDLLTALSGSAAAN